MARAEPTQSGGAVIGGTGRSAGTSTARAPQSAAGAVALLLGCAALGPLFTSGGWVVPVVGTVAAVAAVGAALRTVRVPGVLVLLGQVLVLAALITMVLTDTGVLGIVPGPAAVEQLHALSEGAREQIATEKLPVAVTPELLLLLLASLGSAAIVVDLLVAGLRVPAVAGLVLLCVAAVPASLSPSLLPWWSFVLGAAAVLVLLVIDRGGRTASAGPGAGAAGLRSPTMVATVALSLACALAVGATATAVGTAGRVPAGGSGSGGGVALSPFTQLRGELGERSGTALFTVAGMARPTYLRAVTLDRFVNNQGWVVGQLAAGDAPGPAMGRQQLLGPAQNITVHGQRYTDRWLPSPGIPVSVRGVDTPLQGYTYDPEAGVLQTTKRQPLPAYSVQGVDPGGSAQQLRALGSTPQSQTGIDPRWRQLDGVDPQVAELARTIAGDAPSTFDAAVALNAFFTNPDNGFTYDLSTGNGAAGRDALLNFLTVTKRGFCEQYASAMAVLLRELGIAARVVLGYTPGTGNPRLRTITTDDAHAWVEVFFADVGWVTFDPTPLAGGRGIIPPYVAQAGAQAAAQPAPAQAEPAGPAGPATPDSAIAAAPPPPTGAESQTGPAASAAGRPGGPSPGWLVAALVLLVGVTACGPGALRRHRRKRRLVAGTPDAAWAELVDLSADHGADVARTETPRAVGVRLSEAHALDEQGRAAVAAIIAAVETQWYGAAEDTTRGTPRSQRQPIEELVAAWRRCAPLSARERALPRSVLPRSVLPRSVLPRSALHRFALYRFALHRFSLRRSARQRLGAHRRSPKISPDRNGA